MEEIVPGLTWMDIISIVLSTLCQFISGQRFYQEAYRGIQTRALGMGFLVALGTTCAYFFGLFSILQSVATKGDVTSYPDNLMTSTMLITFVLLGKYLETRAKTYTFVLLTHRPSHFFLYPLFIGQSLSRSFLIINQQQRFYFPPNVIIPEMGMREWKGRIWWMMECVIILWNLNV